MRLSAYNSTANTTYTLTESPIGGPYLHVNNSYYLPLTTSTSQGVRAIVESGTNSYRPMVYTSASGSTYDSYYTSSVDPGNMSSTTALTRSSTSDTVYLTRASTSDTVYYTRQSTSDTVYGTQVFTTDTSYLTEVRTTNTVYGTQVSTTNTQYLTQVSTTNTQYLTAAQTTGTDYITGSVTTGQKAITSYTRTISSSIIMRIIDGVVYNENDMLTYGYMSFWNTNGWVVMSSNDPNLTVEDMNVAKHNDGQPLKITLQYTSNPVYYRSESWGGTWNGVANTGTTSYDVSNTYTTVNQPLTPQEFSLNYQRYSSTLTVGYYPSYMDVVWGEAAFSGASWTSTFFSSIGYENRTTQTRYSRGSLTSLEYQETLDAANPVQATVYFTETQVTDTHYRTQQITTNTIYNTAVVTTNTVYSTAVATTGTTYLTQVFTTNTIYGTQVYTTGTTYLTRVSTSDTSYLTRSSTSDTIYLTRESTSGYTGITTSTSSSSMTTWK